MRKRMSLRALVRRATLGVLLGALAMTLFAGIANGEGYWTSYLSNIYPNYPSRTWTDNHIDANSTYVRFDNCRDGTANTNVSAAVRLYREVPFWPAEDRGMVRLYCYSSATGYYGEQPTAGNFHWTIEDVNGGYNGLSSNYVETGY